MFNDLLKIKVNVIWFLYLDFFIVFIRFIK